MYTITRRAIITVEYVIHNMAIYQKYSILILYKIFISHHTKTERILSQVFALFFLFHIFYSIGTLKSFDFHCNFSHIMHRFLSRRQLENHFVLLPYLLYHTTIKYAKKRRLFPLISQKFVTITLWIIPLLFPIFKYSFSILVQLQYTFPTLHFLWV